MKNSYIHTGRYLHENQRYRQVLELVERKKQQILHTLFLHNIKHNLLPNWIDVPKEEFAAHPSIYGASKP